MDSALTKECIRLVESGTMSDIHNYLKRQKIEPTEKMWQAVKQVLLGYVGDENKPTALKKLYKLRIEALTEERKERQTYRGYWMDSK
jgi:hypothetical protein